MRVLVTGTAGFIGAHVAAKLLELGAEVVGIDNLNDYYDIELKKARLRHFCNSPRYSGILGDIADQSTVESVFSTYKPSRVIHLAAQPGVRYAARNPHAYVQSNVVGFLNILEGCRKYQTEHLVFASTSSIYGANRLMPYSEHQPTEHPLSLYAATKKADEVMAHSYSHLYGLPCTGLRFFTVYGPWGRPDMAPMIFAGAITSGEPIELYNGGHHKRSFTYVDDIVEGVVRILDRPAKPDSSWNPKMPDPATSAAPFRIYNIGHPEPVELLRFVSLLEASLGCEAIKKMRPLQPGDVLDTAADTADLNNAVGYIPKVSVEQGVPKFVAWFKSYHSQARRASL